MVRGNGEVARSCVVIPPAPGATTRLKAAGRSLPLNLTLSSPAAVNKWAKINHKLSTILTSPSLCFVLMSQPTFCVGPASVESWHSGTTSRLSQQLLLIVFYVLLEVFLHRGLVNEFLLAFGIRTAERPFARMSSDVLIEDGFLPEALGALRTHVRLFTCVYPDVLIQDRFLTERLREQNQIYPSTLDSLTEKFTFTQKSFKLDG
jgi:hypothetical protein